MKDTKSWAGTFLLAILAGIGIALGCTIYLSSKDPVMGAFLFSFGLMTICAFGWKLFTGQVGYVSYLNMNHWIFLLLVWCGNYTGTFLTSTLLSFTRHGQKLQEKAIQITQAKLDDTYLSLFLLAIFCGMLMFIAVDGFKNNPHSVGKYLGVIFSVMLFILCGFEHCVANMFYFLMAGMTTKSMICILVMSVGNAVGGAGLSAAMSWVRRAAEPPKKEEPTDAACVSVETMVH
nr:formate/nitrite transporter family protein [Clostridium minihomine]